MKKVIIILLSALLLLGLCSCSSRKEQKEAASDAAFKPALDTQRSADIVVMGNYANFEALEAVFDDFNAYYPNVSLSFLMPDNYNNSIGVILDSSSAPNIYFNFNWMIGRDAYEASFRHAEDLSDPSLGFDFSCIRQNLLFRDENGALPMVPVFATSYGMLVNEDLFAKEGLKVPSTFSELLSVCAALKEKGYLSPMMGYIPESAGDSFAFSLMYPYYCSLMENQPDAVAAANGMTPEAGEYMRSPLEYLKKLSESGCFDLEECRKIENYYTAVILRFFEGDVPMMICTGDTVSGTRKRESQSEAFTANPFNYTFHAIPATEDGAFLVDTASFHFAVNKDCSDLDMTNEFMRFLISSAELNKMAEIKRLVSPTTDLSYDNTFAPLGQIPPERIVSPEKIGLLDAATIQLRSAAYKVVTGELTVDEAVTQFGTL